MSSRKKLEKELRRRCRLYGSGSHAVKKIKSRSKPLLETSTAVYDIVEGDAENVERKLLECHNLREKGASAMQWVDSKKYITLQQLISLLEREYTLFLSPGELSVLIFKYDCVEEGQINFSKFTRCFMRDNVKIKEVCSDKAEKVAENIQSKKVKALTNVLFPVEKMDYTTITAEILISALNKLDLVKAIYPIHSKYFNELRHTTLSGSLSRVMLKDFLKQNLGLVLTLEESQAIILQYQGVSGGNSDNIPMSFVVHHVYLFMTGGCSCFTPVTMDELVALNRPPPEYEKNSSYIQLLREHDRLLLTPMLLPVILPVENTNPIVTAAQVPALSPLKKHPDVTHQLPMLETTFNMEKLQLDMKRESEKVNPYLDRLNKLNSLADLNKSKKEVKTKLITPLNTAKRNLRLAPVASTSSIFTDENAHTLVRPSDSYEGAVHAGELMKNIILPSESFHDADAEDPFSHAPPNDAIAVMSPGKRKSGRRLTRGQSVSFPKHSKSVPKKNMIVDELAQAAENENKRMKEAEESDSEYTSDEEDDMDCIPEKDRKSRVKFDNSWKNAGVRLPYEITNRMTSHKGGTTSVLRSKTPLMLHRPVRPLDEKVSALMDLKTTPNSKTKTQEQVEYAGGGALPFYALPSMSNAKQVANNPSRKSFLITKQRFFVTQPDGNRSAWS